MRREPDHREKRSSPARQGAQGATTGGGVVAVLRTADRLRRYLSQVVAAEGLTRQQYNVLRILRGAGADGLPTMQIRERMMEQAPGITRLIDRLVGNGWVERRPAPNDRRRIYCRITTRGLELLSALDDAVDAADERTFQGIGPRHLSTLIRLLEQVEGNIPGV